jgi:hypothetical protein
MGAFVTSKTEQVVTLLERIFGNEMVYTLKRKSAGLRLVEDITESTVRLQTNDPMLRETFWNYYHNKV